jgi:hypothetical protein
MEIPSKKHFYGNSLLDELHQKLTEAVKYMEDKIFDIIEGKDTNVSIFALSSATARVIGAVYAKSPLVNEDDLKILTEDFGKALIEMYHVSKKYNIEEKD